MKIGQFEYKDGAVYGPKAYMLEQGNAKLNAIMAGRFNAVLAARPDVNPVQMVLVALDAAAQVLAETAEPMICRQMIEPMIAKFYWTPPNPARSRRILCMPPSPRRSSRFIKAGRGQFALANSVRLYRAEL